MASSAVPKYKASESYTASCSNHGSSFSPQPQPTLASLPVAPGVSTHSIIPVLGNGPLAEGKDGVVAYKSAHITPVDSELVVRGSGHSTQGNR